MEGHSVSGVWFSDAVYCVGGKGKKISEHHSFTSGSRGVVMEDYQQRVIVEKQELDVKILSLTEFMSKAEFMAVDPSERVRLRMQMGAMTEYSSILGMRIAAFSAPEATGG